MQYKESEILELKSSFGEWKEIIISLSAFANKKGGTVVVGLDENANPLHMQIGNNTCRAKKTKPHKENRWKKNREMGNSQFVTTLNPFSHIHTLILSYYRSFVLSYYRSFVQSFIKYSKLLALRSLNCNTIS